MAPSYAAPQPPSEKAEEPVTVLVTGFGVCIILLGHVVELLLLLVVDRPRTCHDAIHFASGS